MATTDAPKALLSGAKFAWLPNANWVQVKQYAPTFLTEFTVMASQIVVYKLAAYYLAKAGFSEYALARRTVSLIFPIPVLGMSVGLPRYISFSNGRKDPQTADRYYSATLKCAGLAAVLCFAFINLFPRAFTALFFGSPNYHRLAFPISLMILGLCAHTVACGYFRGHRQLNRANALQVINLALLPVLVFVPLFHSLEAILTILGLLSLVSSGMALYFTPWQCVAKNSRTEIHELLRYGIQRVPGDFFLMALFTLPATIVAHIYGVEQAGFVAFGISIVSMIGGVFAPVGLVLLPKATEMLADGSHADLRSHLNWIIRITLVSAAAITFTSWIAIPTVIRFYLGNGFGQVAEFARILLLACVPYCLYLVVRNLVDAYHEYGVTTAILGGGTVFFVASFWGMWHFIQGMSAILVSFVAATFLISAFSSLECRRILKA
jgi:O-antigen/teichoic acid export membrane protein